MQEAREISTFRLGELLNGGQLRTCIIGAYMHGIPVTLQVDGQHCTTIFVDNQPEFLGTNGKNIEDMLPRSEPHSHFVRADINPRQIFYDPKEDMYRVY